LSCRQGGQPRLFSFFFVDTTESDPMIFLYQPKWRVLLVQGFRWSRCCRSFYSFLE
jgi:hypothetical protein